MNKLSVSTLQKHYHPTVALYGKHLIKGASSQGPGSLPPHLSKKSVSELLKAYALSEEDPFVSVPLPPPHPADKATKKVSVLLSQQLERPAPFRPLNFSGEISIQLVFYIVH